MSAQAPPSASPSAPASPSKSPVANSKPGILGRVWEWFWGGAAMREMRASSRATSAEVIELRRRAGLTAELGRMAMEPPRPLVYGPAHDVACGLFRQSIAWSLLARQQDAATPAAAAPKKNADFGALWAAADRQLLLQAAEGHQDAVEEIRRAFEHAQPQELAELPPKELRALAGKSCLFAESLVDLLDDRQATIQRIWIRRAFGLGLVVCAAVLAAIGVTKTLDAREHRTNLAQGKSWTASSHFPEFGCTSPAQECADSPDYFFHTKEEDDPWFILDLQTVQPISSVRVINRQDCCQERLAPLVVEVSRDQQTWQEVARNEKEFRSWKASFGRTDARYVKLHVPRRSILHLREVRVFK